MSDFKDTNADVRWYVIHTYSGYENKVKSDLEKTVESHDLGDKILEIKVPMEETIEVKNGKKKVVSRKVFPGYVFVKMLIDEKTWYFVRNTRGVTSFVGPGSKPIPLTDEEVCSMGVENIPITIDIEVGDGVQIVNGPLEGHVGEVLEISHEKQKIKVNVSMFGRETPVELEFYQVKSL